MITKYMNKGSLNYIVTGNWFSQISSRIEVYQMLIMLYKWHLECKTWYFLMFCFHDYWFIFFVIKYLTKPILWCIILQLQFDILSWCSKLNSTICIKLKKFHMTPKMLEAKHQHGACLMHVGAFDVRTDIFQRHLVQVKSM